MKKTLVSKFSIVISIIFILLLSFSLNCSAKDKQTIAILPFEMISAEDISYIQSGILQMLQSRLAWKDNVTVTKNDIITTHLKTIDIQNTYEGVSKIAQLTGSDYVLTGSITYFSDAFSIDARIYDIKNRQYLSFFEQSNKIDEVIPKLNIIAAKINKKVFDRQTMVYENLARQEKENAEQWKRQNPEKMMPSIPKDEQEEKSSFWRFWEYL